jgi:hypothetical protein
MIKYTILFSIASWFLMACVHDDDYKNPPINQGQVIRATVNIPYLLKTAPAFTGKNGVEALGFSNGEILEGYVISSDHAGNIYKNLFIVTEDGTQGIMLSINKSGLYADYPLGSKIYIKLDNLYYGKQNGMVQIGMFPANPDKYVVDQITPSIMKSRVVLGKDKKNEEELVIKTNASGKLLTVKDVNNNEKYLCTLVEISGVEFNEPGKTFVRNHSSTDNQINNTNLNYFAVPVSNYASFSEYKIPYGEGKLRGIMTRYDGMYKTYRLIIRTIDDVKNFPTTRPFFSETFNKVSDVSTKPKINNAIGFDNSQPVTYSDPYGKADIRTSGISFPNPLVWFPAKTNASLIIDHINTFGHKQMILSFKLNAGIFNSFDIGYVDDLILKCNDVEIELPHIALDVNNNKNTFYTVRIAIPDGTQKIEFFGSASKNKKGIRIDTIQLED